jgi:hypothetical protein
LIQHEKKEFINENDMVMIKYTFTYGNTSLFITIFNKLHQPIYIDFGKTALILNNIQLSEPYNHGEQVRGLIAPQAYITLSSNSFMNKFIEFNSQDSIEDAHLETVNDTYDGKKQSFNENNSPIYFRSILTISTQEDFTNPVYYDNSFWVSGVTETSAEPSIITNKPPNQLCISKMTGFMKVLGFTAALATLFIIVLMTPGTSGQ